jgi:hypothetical protein
MTWLKSKITAGILSVVVLAGCSSSPGSNGAPVNQKPPLAQTGINVITSWGSTSAPYDEYITTEVVTINGYCAILIWNGYKDTIGITYVPNTPGQAGKIEKGCP